MGIEEKIDQLIAVIQENTAALKAGGGGGGASPTASTGATKATKKNTVTREQVTELARGYAKEHSKAAAKAVIGKFGKDIASVPDNKLADLAAALKEAPAAEDEEEDDGL
jgi:hypothetical protein